MVRPLSGLLLAALLLSGCQDDTLAPRDVTPPAPPRGLFSVTGNGQVTLHWLANTEPDVAGYHVYVSSCARGGSCPYDPIGTTYRPTFVVQGIPNGVTRFYAVTAFDESGNESELSEDDVYDTPRPSGVGAVLRPVQDRPDLAGWDFSADSVRAWDDTRTDMFFSANGTINEMLVPDPRFVSIQDMGFSSSFDLLDFAPPAGWSPTGSVELIVGHNYVVWTADDHFAKFRVTALDPQLVFDWAYQTAPGNGELRGRPAVPDRVAGTTIVSSAGVASALAARGFPGPRPGWAARYLTPISGRKTSQ